MRQLLQQEQPLPLEEERARLLREVSREGREGREAGLWFTVFQWCINDSWTKAAVPMPGGRCWWKCCRHATQQQFCSDCRSSSLLQCRQNQPSSRPLPRAQVGAALLDLYQGQAANLIRAAGQSAVRLVRLVTAAFSGFRDHCVYRCVRCA